MDSESKRRAIVADDNLMFATPIAAALSALGCEARTVTGGPGTVDQIATAAPDFVLVNLAAGRFSAPDLIRALRARTGLENTRILGYAGHVERELLQAGRDAGCDMVAPNSAVRTALPEVLAKLERRAAGGDAEAWEDE